MRHVAVFDTNVLMSGVGWKGAPFQCLELARTDVVEGITCAEIIDELVKKLASKLGLSAEMIDESVTDLLTFLTVEQISSSLRVITADPDDDKVLECAVVGNATHRQWRQATSTAAANVPGHPHR